MTKVCKVQGGRILSQGTVEWTGVGVSAITHRWIQGYTSCSQSGIRQRRLTSTDDKSHGLLISGSFQVKVNFAFNLKSTQSLKEEWRCTVQGAGAPVSTVIDGMGNPITC